MRQVWISRIGKPEVLQVREAPDPEPKAGEIRIRVKAAGVNFADISARVGLYPDAPKVPCVVGYEVSGTVEKLGEGVSELSEGQRVLALTRFGGYSDVVVVPHAQAAPIPDTLSFEKAAGVPVNYLTAWLMLMRLGNMQAGEKVLVHAVAGGVGQAATQICKWRGAEIFGTASGPKHERLKQAGVDHCIDYRNQDFEKEVMRLTQGEGVDLVIDAVGGKSFLKSYNCLASLGRLFCFGLSSAVKGTKRSLLTAAKAIFQLPKFKPMQLMDKNRGVYGVNLGHLWHVTPKLRGMLIEIVELIEAGHLDPVIDKTFSFADAPASHQYIQDRKNFGKVLLVP